MTPPKSNSTARMAVIARPRVMRNCWPPRRHRASPRAGIQAFAAVRARRAAGAAGAAGHATGGLDDALGEREPEAHAPGLARPAALTAKEGGEDLRQIVGRDPD